MTQEKSQNYYESAVQIAHGRALYIAVQTKLEFIR